MNARSILTRSLIFGFALTAAAQLLIELPLEGPAFRLASRAAFLVLVPGRYMIIALTAGKVEARDVWFGLALNVLILAGVCAAILLIIKRLTNDRSQGNGPS